MRRAVPHLASRWRITVRVLVAVLVVAGITGVVAVRAIESEFTAELDDELVGESQALVAAAEVIDLDELAQIANRPGLTELDKAILVVDAQGVDVAVPAGDTDDPLPLPDVESVPFTELRARAGEPFEIGSVGDGPRYRVVVAQLDDGRLVVAAATLTELEDALRTLVKVLLIASLVAWLVLGVTIALVSGHVTRPLDAMIDTAEAISAGDAVTSDDLRARVATEGVEDVARLGRALNAMLERLERAFADREASEEALRRFVADASHELRTPLAGILGYAQLHSEGIARRPEQVDHAMARIAAEGERMRLLVDELLLLARLDESRTVERAPVDLAALAGEAVGDARAVDPDRPLALDLGDGDLVVEGDVASLRRALDNLLANARAHTPPGTPVTVTVAAEGDEVRVAVSDEGPGLDPDDLPHVFERFFRAERSRARPGGSGLGLAIVAAIAEAHGGRATVASEPGRGATFTLVLPA